MMDKKYLFRADSTYKEGESITCKEPKSKRRVHDHVTYLRFRVLYRHRI